MLRTRLFAIADERGIRYKWLAQQMGYTQEYLSRVKHGRGPITEEFRRRACLVFSDVPETTLFFVADDEQNHRSMTPVERVA